MSSGILNLVSLHCLICNSAKLEKISVSPLSAVTDALVNIAYKRDTSLNFSF